MLHRRRPARRPTPPCPGRACATTRRAISCATGMQVGDGVLFYHSSCPSPALPESPAWPACAPARTPHSSTPPRPTSTPISAQPTTPRWLLLDAQALRKTRLIKSGRVAQHPAATCADAGAAKRQPAVHHAGGGIRAGRHHRCADAEFQLTQVGMGLVGCRPEGITRNCARPRHGPCRRTSAWSAARSSSKLVVPSRG